MKTTVTKNLVIHIGGEGASLKTTIGIGELPIRLEARTAADGEILSAVLISTEASGKIKSVQLDAETIERVAKALAEYRREQADYRHVCADHGYGEPHAYRCAKCDPGGARADADAEQAAADAHSPMVDGGPL